MRGLTRDFSLLKSFLDHRQVSYLIFYVTNRCNFSCDFCFYCAKINKRAGRGELELSEIEKITQKIGPLIQLSLTGGEPFLRRDLADITGLFIKNTGAAYITIPTNASLTEAMADYCNGVLPRYPETYFRLPFSIDGIKEGHDRIRSSPGAFAKITQSYAALSPLRRKYPNLVLDANICYSAQNEPSILDTLKTLSAQFDFDNLSITYLRGEVKNRDLIPASPGRYLEANTFLENLRRKKEKRRFYFFWRAVRDLSREDLIASVLEGKFITPCTAGRKIMTLDEAGQVFPCEILEQSFGNIRDYDYDLKRMMQTKGYKDILRKIKDTKCKCSFECALAANVLWGKANYFRLFLAALRNTGS